MRARAQGFVLWTVGVTTIVATLNGRFLFYVKPSMKWPLFAAAAVLVVAGAYLLLSAPEKDHAETGHDHEGEPEHEQGSGHGHHHGAVSRVGWAFVIPFVLMPFAVNAPLGAYSAERDSGVVVRQNDDVDTYPPLPAGGVVPLKLGQFWERAAFDHDNTMAGRRIRLVGFVSPVKEGDGWALTRQVVMCCAADAFAVKILPVGGRRLPKDTWVELEGTWIPSTKTGDARENELPRIKVESMKEIPTPREPYE